MGAGRGGARKPGWGGAFPTGAPREAPRPGTMSGARSHRRASLFLAAVFPRGVTTRVTGRRELSARPAPQEPGMEYQVPRRRRRPAAEMTRGLGPGYAASRPPAGEGTQEPETAELGGRGPPGVGAGGLGPGRGPAPPSLEIPRRKCPTVEWEGAPGDRTKRSSGSAGSWGSRISGVGNRGAVGRAWGENLENRKLTLALCQGPVAGDQSLMPARQVAPV